MRQGLIVDVDGTKRWYKDDKLHREDGPAIEKTTGDKSWWFNDKLHREDGPAMECLSGYKEWYLNGVKQTEEEYNDYMLVRNFKKNFN